jgi:hypothetical protein
MEKNLLFLPQQTEGDQQKDYQCSVNKEIEKAQRIKEIKLTSSHILCVLLM